MKVNGQTIIITDPCYISKKEDWGEGFNYDECCINSGLGFTDYIMEDTGVGDGSWEVYMTKKKESNRTLEKLIDNLYIEEDYTKNIVGEKIGEYGADAGMSGVFFLSDVEKYGPKDNIEELEKIGCLARIEGFIGEVYPYFDESDMLHFIGIGNNSFYTA